jgi:hydrogenase maturation protease
MHGPTLFVGVGSPHGDDCAGWLVADALSGMDGARVPTPATGPLTPGSEVTIHKIAVPADLFDWLDDAGRLIICDAVRAGRPAGTLYRWPWPDARISHIRPAGCHDLGLSDVLEMAGRLGRLPSAVVVWGIEAGQVAPDSGVSTEIRRALPDLVERISRELGHA